MVGARRLLDSFKDLGKKEYLIQGHFDKAISYIKKHKGQEKIAVLVSGDPGVHSFLDKVSAVLGKGDYAVVPGISTVQLGFARLGESWLGARILSLHGRRIKDLAERLMDCPKAFLFTDAGLPPDKIAQGLMEEGLENRDVVILENLSYPEERVIKTDLKRLCKAKGFGLCAMIIYGSQEKLKKGRLYGVGLGPGDPKLVTLRAKEILDAADIIFVPKGTEDGSSWARGIVEAVVSKEKDFTELTFPMTSDKKVLNRYWMNAACRIAKEVRRGKRTVFVTIGDPFIYSTYGYLLKTLRANFPGIDIETVPGVSAFNAASAKVQFPLTEGSQRMAVVPVRDDLKGVRQALLDFDTVVLMKVGSKLDKVVRLLKELRLVKNAVLISRLGHEGEKIIYDLASLKDKSTGYLSVILVKKD